MVDRITHGVEWDSVISRNEEGARRAVMHLVERGHRRIGGIFGREHVSSIQQRIAGFRAALESAGITPDPDYIRKGCCDQDQAQIAAQSLLNLPNRPTALFTSNNQVMIGTLHAIRNHGLTCPAVLIRKADICLPEKRAKGCLKGLRSIVLISVSPCGPSSVDA